MGIDYVDLVYRIERRLGATLDLDKLGRIVSRRGDFTVKDLFESALAGLPGTDVADRELDRDEVRLIVHECVAETLGVDLSEVSDEKRLIKDLGME